VAGNVKEVRQLAEKKKALRKQGFLFMHWVRYIGNTSSIIIAKRYLEVFHEKLAVFSCKKETASK